MTDADDRRGPDRVSLGTVLVVDDSLAIRRLISRALSEGGYNVRLAADGREAIDACRADGPDLVLLDIDMPVLDGLAALREMKREPALASIPVLFLTARTGADDVVAGLELGAQDYVRKPCEPEELRARVATALRIKEQRDSLERQARALDELSATDALTGLGNRRRLEAVTADLRGDIGGEGVVGVLIIDVDHFKRVNDERGHAIGDLVLSVVAARLRSVLEPGETVVRWGGEEFLVLAADPKRAPLAVIGERLREAIASSPVGTPSGAVLSVTASVGAAIARLDRLDEGFGNADAALYAAKSAGRNRVEVHNNAPACD